MTDAVVPSETPLDRMAGAWWLVLLFGMLSIAAGVIVLAQPGISLATLAWVTGIFLLVDGAFEVVAALSPRAEGRGMLAFFGVLSVIAGLYLVRHPIAGVVAIALLLGIWFVAIGIMRLIDAFDRSERRAWNLTVAALEILAGVIIVASPDIGVGTLALIVGIGFLLRGFGMTMIAWTIRSVSRA